MPLSKKQHVRTAGEFAIWMAILIISITLIITQTNRIIEFFKEQSIDSKTPATTWTISEILTETIPETWWNSSLEEIPSDVMGYYTHILEKGVEGVDYIQKTPNPQPNLNAKISTDNNVRMHDYLYKNQIVFQIPATSKKAYIMFITTSPVAKDKNIFVGLDGKTIGWLDKNNLPIETYEKNQYLYELNNLLLVGNNWYKFSKDLSWPRGLYLNAVVWEANNKVEKIIIFFK